MIILIPIVHHHLATGATRCRLRQRRAFGQLLRAARRFYGREWRAFMPIALTALAVVAGRSRGSWLLLDVLVGETESAAGRPAGFKLDQDMIT